MYTFGLGGQTRCGQEGNLVLRTQGKHTTDEKLLSTTEGSIISVLKHLRNQYILLKTTEKSKWTKCQSNLALSKWQLL